jgi:biotin synthase
LFSKLLDTALNEGINKKLALQILEESYLPQNALKLFAAASSVRDKNLGKELYFTAGIGGVLPCKIVPRCRYCFYAVAEPFPLSAMLACVKKIEELGIKQLHLGGGSCLDGYDEEILTMVRAIQDSSEVLIEVNFGPSLSIETIKSLKALQVLSITSSLETTNEELFRQTKPGDSLEKRKEILETCEEEGIPIRSMMMVGLGENYADRIEHLFYMRQFNNLYHLRFSRFKPFPHTVMRNRPPSSPWELARTIAVARLIMPKVNLGLAVGNQLDDIPLWYAAGGGSQVLGIMVTQKNKNNSLEGEVHEINGAFIHNQMPIISHYLNGMGVSISL